mmetsp:Transcript_55068/g.87346  ORF Transcript_55068/g.87346 Transcript_55068/m.87346 type:complete len:408 (-) Transcript_55068:111-1334(-)|eukprot:CAMPEP_0169119262 /NCGR_PEP_ID=MMETSP1015-20121227/31453_1 /TAXON_ID=342587 /ORGANISM="Karlodinium micrum, Strain CCMP2283" /LENGTH=407 /DNA_ID=CAMNT_0009182111 /DNA_START=53 /DNA_END=1276 /DNA_ORIENTATION=+
MTVSSAPGSPLELPLPTRGANKAEGKIGRSPKAKTNIGANSPESAVKEKNTKIKDNAVTMQLSKTKMCAFFERGKCASTNCRYAHSVDELRIAPNLQKTKLCRAYLSGGCNNENCFYAHGDGDLRVTQGIYKTQICNFFERGYCKKGDRCNHAHGAADLRPLAQGPTCATPMSKSSTMSTNTGGESTRSRRSPLPLAELLVDSEGNFNIIPPTPTKSVSELASLAFSPMPSAIPSSPMWGQYGMHGLSPVSALGPVGDLASRLPFRDAVDILTDHTCPSANLMYTMDALEPAMEKFEHHMPIPEQTPEKALTLLSVDPSPSYPFLASAGMYGAPGLTPVSSEKPTPVTTAESLKEEFDEPKAESGESGRDPALVNLNERLASLDSIVQQLSNDIAIRSEPSKRLHRI